MDDGHISAFWADARLRGGLNPVAGYLGATASDTLPPPAFSFGATPQESDRLLDLVLAGRKTATTSVLWEYEEEARARGRAQQEEEGSGDTLVETALDLALPAPGSLSIVVDGREMPRALIRTTHVDVVPFREVDEAHARRDGMESLEAWRAEHRRFFTEHAPAGQRLTEETMVVLERFVVVVPANARRAAKRAGLL